MVGWRDGNRAGWPGRVRRRCGRGLAVSARPEAAAEASAPVAATLVLEDSNPHDDQAVAVHIDGERAGYLSRANARAYRADLAAAGTPNLTVRCKAKIVGGFETREGQRAHFGLKLDLPRLSA